MFKPPTKFPDLPPILDGVARAVASENLKAVARQSQDPQVFLGLAFLARAGDPVRRELGQMAASGRAEYKPVVAVLGLEMDGVEEATLNDVLEADPENALGYYLLGTLRHISNGRTEALQAFRRAGACAQLRLYEAITGEALFKAVDALRL